MALPISAVADDRTDTVRACPPQSRTTDGPRLERARQRPAKAQLEGSWLPILPSRSGRGRGCGNFVYGTPSPSTKIAAFDLDGTVIRPRGGKAFPKNASDWEFCSPDIVPKLRATYRQGYALVLISNQASSSPSLSTDFRKKIPFVARKIGVPLRVMACFDFDEYRKPAPGMWNALIGSFNGEASVDYHASFYVGDAAGRPSDHADTDRKFALNTGLRFLTPEQFFLGEPEDPHWTLWGFYPHGYDHTLLPPPEQVHPNAASHALSAIEVVVLVGPPAIGKSAYAAKLQRQGYSVMTMPQSSRSATATLAGSLSATDLHTARRHTRSDSSNTPQHRVLVIDASLPTRASRATLLAALRESLSPGTEVSVRCIVWTSFTRESNASGANMGSRDDTLELLALARHNAVFRLLTITKPAPPPNRGHPLPPLQEFESWARQYEAPECAEGFSRITPVRFSFDPACANDAAGRRVGIEEWQRWLADVFPGKAKKTGKVALRGVDEGAVRGQDSPAPENPANPQ